MELLDHPCCCSKVTGLGRVGFPGLPVCSQVAIETRGVSSKETARSRYTGQHSDTGNRRFFSL